MNIKFPHTIENCVGEKISFQSIEKNHKEDKVLLEAYCNPGCGPTMHTHLQQDESLTVESGKMGYQILGQVPNFWKKENLHYLLVVHHINSGQREEKNSNYPDG